MLRHQILTNFIHFQKQQKLDYEPGCNLFIGENCSGKSSVLEGIRRCSSLTQNTSMSPPHFTKEMSAVTCIFSIDGDKDYLFTSTIRLPKKENQEDVWVKVVSYKEFNEIDLVKQSRENTLGNTQMPRNLVNEVAPLVSDFLQFQESPNEECLSKIFEKTECVFSEKVVEFLNDVNKTDVVETDCESLLRKYIDNGTIQTFPVRGIGPCQWSKSPKVEYKERGKNYKEAQERSEILQWYLKEIRSGGVPQTDQVKVQTYFDTITNDCGFQFELKDDYDLVARRKKTRKRRLRNDDSDTSIAMLKVPEGISEAMISSILLGISTFKTIGLEEPERGMHPQMIERMRDLVLKVIKDKTVLISSHHPNYLGPWTIPRLFIFKRFESNGISFEIIQGSKLGVEDQDKKTPRIITSENFASIFFARRVLFVEGEGDYLFVGAMKHIFLTEEDEERMIKGLITSDNIERFRKFLCSLNIITLCGETSKLRFKNLCDKLSINRYFLLDNDAILDHKKSAEPFLRSFEISCDSETVKKDTSVLEKEGLFVWKYGQFEDALIALGREDDQLKRIIKENNVELKYNEATKRNNRYKLFRKKEVTDINIKTVVLAVLECCLKDKKEGKKTEMLRLIDFLSKISEEQARESISI